MTTHIENDRAEKLAREVAAEAGESLTDAGLEKGSPRAPLGSRLAARFRGLGLEEDLPELRGEELQPSEPHGLEEDEPSRA
jgi:hypothetical protein